MTDATPTTVLELGSLYDLEPAVGLATRGVVTDYRALDGGAPSVTELEAVRQVAAHPGERALAVLVARAGGVDAAVSRPRVMRLAAEHLLGATLFRAVTDRPALDHDGPGAMAHVRLRVGRGDRVRPTPGAVLVSRLPLPAVLYLLARDGLTDAFTQVVAASADELDPPRLAVLLAEVEARVGGVGRVVVAHPRDDADLAGAGWRVERVDTLT